VHQVGDQPRTVSLRSTGKREICITILIGIGKKTELYLLPLIVKRWAGKLRHKVKSLL